MTAIGIAVGCATIRTSEKEMNCLRRIAPRVVSHARAQNSSRVTENGLIDWTAICKDARSLESMRACRLRDHSASSEAGSHTVDDSLSGFPVSLGYPFLVTTKSEILRTESHSARTDLKLSGPESSASRTSCK